MITLLKSNIVQYIDITLLFLLALTILYVFLFRREIVSLEKTISDGRFQSSWLILLSLLVFVDLLIVQPLEAELGYVTTNFRVVNFVFYVGGLWIGLKVKYLGWRRSIQLFFTPPTVFFNFFALVCLLSSLFAPNISHFPPDWNIQHALRILVFFYSISFLAQDLKFVKLEIIYIFLVVLLLRILLPYYEALLSDNIMPWDWIQFKRDTYWYRWSLVSGYPNFSDLSKDNNGLGLQSNSFGFLLSIFFLIFTNHLVRKMTIDGRFIVPIVVFGVTLFHLGSQTAFLIVFIGLILISIVKLRQWALPFLFLIAIPIWNYREEIFGALSFGWTIEKWLEHEYRFTVLFPTAFEGFLNKPWFGYGYLSGQYLYLQDYGLPEHIVEAHNTILSIGLTTGLVGVLPFVIGMFLVAWILIRFWLVSKFDVLSTDLIIVFLSSIIASLFLTDFHYVFDDTLLIRNYPFFLVLLLSQKLRDSNTKYEN